MSQEYAIEVNHITKHFKVYQDKGNTLKEKVLFRNRRKYELREVLKDVSFQIKKGEAVGLIGHNGCGKSTTLKLLTKIMYPDSGTITMRGRVSSLIELGAGFHPDMSGRDNIYINASIFGLTKKEIDARVDDIIAFSELESYIDNPVRTYSSGMYMRLAFAVAINVDADILLIDEILAVGDTNFQSKCFNKLREIKRMGTTIVIVSHALSQIEQICERSIWIHDGVIRMEGAPCDVHPVYLDFMGQFRMRMIENHHSQGEDVVLPAEDGNGTEVWRNGEKIRWGNGQARITGALAYGEDGKEKKIFRTGERIRMEVDYEVKEKVEDAVFGIGIYRGDGLHCYGTNTRIEQFPIFELEKSGRFTFTIEGLELLPGEYDINFTIEKGMGIPVDYYTKIMRIVVYSELNEAGTCRIRHTWNWEMEEHHDGN